ncbi:MAG: hypothetical protein HQ593_06675 [Candidatus Omnitrophica bacterium]|nr:hypothetical protein [Candidatus Omnitrophota bacterium]
MEKKNKKPQRLKSDLISTLSHELRTPLSVIKEGISLLLDEVPGKINGDQKRILEMTKNNTDRLVQAITDFSKACQEDDIAK